MKNKQLQEMLDKSKWYLSEKERDDKSGKLPYCGYCQMRCLDYEAVEVNGIKSFKIVGTHCAKPQEKREEYSLCAIAYNKMVRAHMRGR